ATNSSSVRRAVILLRRNIFPLSVVSCQVVSINSVHSASITGSSLLSCVRSLMLTDDCFRIESLQFNTSNIAATFGSLTTDNEQLTPSAQHSAAGKDQSSSSSQWRSHLRSHPRTSREAL